MRTRASVMHCNTLQHTLQRRGTGVCLSAPASYAQGCLQHTATHCNTLQHTATHTATQVFRRLPGICHIMRTRVFATHCNTLQQTATRCNMLQRTLQHRGSGVCLGSAISCAKGVCNTLQRTATRCNTLQHDATHCNAHCNTGVQAFAWVPPHHAHKGIFWWRSVLNRFLFRLNDKVCVLVWSVLATCA